MSHHAINLADAWEAESDGAVGVRWARRFGRPTGLAAGDTVWLVIDGPAAAAITLNGVPLPAVRSAPAWRAEITPLLRDRNLLLLVPASGGGPRADGGRLPLPAALGRVWLEIVPAAGVEVVRPGR